MPGEEGSQEELATVMAEEVQKPLNSWAAVGHVDTHARMWSEIQARVYITYTPTDTDQQNHTSVTQIHT